MKRPASQLDGLQKTVSKPEYLTKFDSNKKNRNPKQTKQNQYSLIGESVREYYTKKLNVPPLSTDVCNSTANFAGSLPDDLICIDDVNDDENCHINVSSINVKISIN